MSDAIKNEPCQVIWLTRRLFRALSQKSNESLVEFNVTAADRAVMEFLHPDKQLSVPEIADQYSVSRQHIQATVNNLLQASLVTTAANPRHKRSPFIKLTAKGKKHFNLILNKDEQMLAELFSDIPVEHINTTRQTLQALLNKLSATV